MPSQLSRPEAGDWRPLDMNEDIKDTGVKPLMTTPDEANLLYQAKGRKQIKADM
ncbi:hypothetical protein BDN71DRAFT_1457855, partial [Pleurotus eryngii]